MRAVYHGVADLYCYFFELGVKLLKSGGRMGYISSSTFFKTGSGEPLRRYLLEETQLRTVVDFGDLQVFEGVTTYPAIVVLEKTTHPVIPCHPRESGGQAGMTNTLSYLNLKTLPADGLSVAFTQQVQTMQQSRLNSGSWQMESDARGQLRDKLTLNHSTLKQVYGSPLYGIKTGFNEAFVIDRATRDALIAEDPKSADLLKPFLEGKDLKKWRAESQDLWLILCPKGWTRKQSGLSDEAQAQVWMQTHYPALMRRFVPFEIAARKRGDKGEFWWELRTCAYYEAFENPKIVYTRFMAEPLFYLDTDQYYLNNALNIFPDVSYFELGILISSVNWFFIRSTASLMSGGFFQVHGHVLEKCPFPTASNSQRAEIATLAEACQRAAEARRDTQVAFRNRIADLAPTPGIKLNTKLNNWWELDFAAFRAEIKKLYKQDIPLVERNDWEGYFNSQRAIVVEHTAQITLQEAALNRVVYTLFDLTSDEIALIENVGEV
ncbi:MAG: TaqI-like C-terminal specificity domain-containing protein [Nitrosomonadales bacterium]